MASEEPERENRNMFKQLVADFTGDDLLAELQNPSWEIVFKFLERESAGQRIVLVIDEFQYIGKKNPAFPSIFQRIWDQQLQNMNIMVILCGSIVSMMKSQTLDYSSPLYGRRTGQINLKAIRFSEYENFYAPKLRDDLIRKFAVTGGVPRYIQELKDEKSFKDMLLSIFCSTDHILYEEPYFLMHDGSNDVGLLFAITKTIAHGNVKTRDIAQVLEMKVPNLNYYFKILLDLEIVEKITPITESNVEKSKKTLMRIKDHYLRFWFRYIFPNRSYIEQNKGEALVDQVMEKIDEQHVSYVYEEICKEWLIENWERVTGKRLERVGKWWERSDEIDVVGLSESDNYIVLGECKYTASKVDVGLYKDLLIKRTKVQWRNENRSVEFVLFSKSGFTKELLALAESISDLHLVHGTEEIAKTF
jgi:AAA+ ATPase superfamily predicted ATPase